MTSAARKVSGTHDELASANGEPNQEQVVQELQAHTQAYCEAVAEAFDDFFGIQPEPSGVVHSQKGYCPAGNVHYSVPFSGLVNGEYIINVDESVAVLLADCEPLEEDAEREALVELREEVGAAMCELLNTAVGSVIGELAGRYPHLSFASPRISYGQRIYPRIRFGHSDLQTEFGAIRCHFYLDHMELDLATSYARVRASAQKAKAALAAYLEMVEGILADIDIALFWIKPDGSLCDRHSHATARVLGVEASRLQGSFLDLARAHLGEQGVCSSELQTWIDQAFAASDVEDFQKNIQAQCPLFRSMSSDATELCWRWLAVRPQESDQGVASLLVAVQDAKRAEFESQRASSDLIAQIAQHEWSMSDEG